jgi:integrase/recombinase XerD
MARRPKPWFRKSRRAWFVTLDGVQHNLGPVKEEAYERFFELMRQPKEQKVASQSMAAIADAYLDWVQKQRSPDTYEWYRYRLERFVRAFPDLRSADVRPFHVETWVNEYRFSQTSRRNYLRSVKRCLNWAVKQGYLDRNPVASLEVPAGEHKEVVISPVEFDRLMACIRNPDLADLVRVTWETGCRPQESLRVEARHVDLANQRWVIPKSESKTKRQVRVVYLTDAAFRITKRLVAEHPDGRLFRNVNGKPWTTEAVNCAFLAIRHRMGKEEMQRLGVKVSKAEIAEFIPTLSPTRTNRGEAVEKSPAELRCEAKRKLTQRRASELAPRYSLYALRHSWATHALQKGVDPLTVAILMGHQDPSMLSKVYQHLSLNPTHMLEQARKAAS